MNVDDIISNGGATFNRNGMVFLETQGYIVVLDKEHETFIGLPNKHKLAKKLKQYILLAQKFNVLCGVWVSQKDKRIYFDLVEHVMEYSEAVTKGLTRKQKAIYDLANKKEIVL